MSRIILLDELTANKIAAGEVVERPASVVKELIENSIDAQSSQIEVSVTDGGLSEIIITDNGIGMDSDDARMAFARHATSKISGHEDLVVINSLGFRGEALPSIAAVARISLKTKVRDAIDGTEVVIEGGRIMQVTETGCRPGTVIKIQNLFYNTPARQKHMKKASVEAGHISDVVNRFAMGYPNISFQFTNNGRALLKTSGRGDLLEPIISVFGLDTAKEMMPIKKTNDRVSLSGFLGRPSQSRAARHHQVIYLNGRYIKSRVISDAVERAFHGMLMIGRYPIFLLNLTLDPNQVDVNVHPAKTEVRLADSTDLADFITTAATELLNEQRLIPASGDGAGRVIKDKIENTLQVEWKAQPHYAPAIPAVNEEPAYWVAETSVTHPETSRETPLEIRSESPAEPNPHDFPMLKAVGQIDCTYIICQGAEGMYVVDQHAAHERILYDTYMQKPDNFTVVEQLLFPVTIQLTHQEIQLFHDTKDIFASLGFLIEGFGGNTLLLRGVPSFIAKNGGNQIFLDLLDYFSQNRYTISNKELREKATITMACKSAIKANERLNLSEMEALLEQLAATNHPYTCPHGRPTIIYFSGYDLEKKFKRVV